MQQKPTTRRAKGDGSLFKRPVKSGGESWIAKWAIDGRQVMRTVGPVKSATFPQGLTPAKAEARFAEMRSAAKLKPERAKARRTLAEVGESLIERMQLAGRRPSTIDNVDSAIRVHIVPFFGVEPVATISEERVLGFVKALGAKGLSPKSIRNLLINLNSIFEHAIAEGLRTAENPVKRVPKPASVHADGDLRFLRVEEVEALLREVPTDELGRVERPMYLTAALTGMRQGELFALRWRDVDFESSQVRVQQNFVKGQFQSPKSKKGRAVPLSPASPGSCSATATSPRSGEMDLVFAHPQTGRPIDRSKISKRFKAAVKRAGVGGFEPVLDPKTGRQKLDRDGESVVRPLIRFHDLRHTFATTLARGGKFTVMDLQQYMGHADIKTTMIYSHYQPAEQQAGWIEEAFASGVAELDRAVEVDGGDLIDRLRKLAELRDAGVLTEDEFAAAKAPLLARIG